jgi:hypothetical protein
MREVYLSDHQQKLKAFLEHKEQGDIQRFQGLVQSQSGPEQNQPLHILIDKPFWIWDKQLYTGLKLEALREAFPTIEIECYIQKPVWD